ncbi:MAG: DUF4124 domain-containing protein [Nitrospira sp.]
MNAFVLSLVSGLMLWPVIGSAELYKWTDDHGTLHITDTPPSVPKKKSATTVEPAPRSAVPMKHTVQQPLPEQSLAEVRPVPGSRVSSPVSEEAPIQWTMEGVSPIQASVTSAWQVFDGTQINAKAAVQWWKDEQRLDHFVDVLPMARGSAEIVAKTEDASPAHRAARTKERAASPSRTRHQAME